MKSKTLLALALAAAALTACTSGGGGRGWIPQGPGEEPKARSEPAAQAAPRRAPPPAAPRDPAQTTSPFRGPVATAPAPAAPSAASIESTAPAGGYTQATRYGDLLFVSGQIAMDPRTNQMVAGGIEEQTRQVMENIRQVLEAHRLTMANVVSVTVYMKDLNQFRGMDEAYERFFRTALPARSVVEVARLPRGALLEISVIAGR